MSNLQEFHQQSNERDFGFLLHNIKTKQMEVHL